MTPSPWNLGWNWRTPSWRQQVLHILPCSATSASTVRDRKRSSITLNKNSTRAFERAINRGYAAPNFLKMGIKYLNLSAFIQVSTIKDEKSAAKFHYIKTVGGKVVAQWIAFRVVSIYCQGVAPFPWYLNAKGPTPIGSTCVAYTSPHSAAAVTSLRH